MTTISKRILPENPLEFIRECVKKGNILWTYHVNMRMKARFIPRKIILDSVDNYEIIEEYPEDKYFPSYLIRSEHGGYVFHVLFAADSESDNVRVVTAYYPNPDEWDSDLKTRGKSK